MTKKSKLHVKLIAKVKDAVADKRAPDKKAPRQKRQKDGAGWLDDLGSDLAAFGLRVKAVEGDGNCFFRAVADQLGPPADHAALRARTVAFMQAHRADFEPYLEDDEKFEHYCERMARVRPSTVAGRCRSHPLLRSCHRRRPPTKLPVWPCAAFMLGA